MTKGELLALWQVLNSFNDGVRRNPKFLYALARNRDKVKGAVEAINEALKAPAQIIEYEQARLALCVKHSEKNGDGQPKIAGNNFIILPEELEQFNAALDQLTETHGDALKEWVAAEGERTLFLGEEVEGIEFYKIMGLDCLPDLTDGQMTNLLPLIKEED